MSTTRTIQLAIRADRETVWHALIDGTVTPGYYVGFAAEFDALRTGSSYRYSADGQPMITGEVLAVDPLTSLRTSFNGHWEPSVDALPESTVTFTLLDPAMPLPGITVLRCDHEDLADPVVADHLELGWVTILSGLKTLLETGAPLVAAPAADVA